MLLKETIRVGEYIPDFMHIAPQLPEGTVVRIYNETHTIRTPGTLPTTGYWHQPVRLERLVQGEELPLPRFGVDDLLWRIRDCALAAAERSGVSISPVRDLLHRLGADERRFGIGSVVSNRGDIMATPEGTVLFAGDPAQPKSLNVWQRLNGSLTHLLGNSDRPMGAPLVIRSGPGLALLERGVASKVELAKIGVKAMRVGKTYKRSQNWCGVFEDTLAALGIEDSLADIAGEVPFSPGDVVSKENCARLPVGSLLIKIGVHDRRRVTIFQRVERSRNKAGTRRVWGHADDPSANSADDMTVFSVPDIEETSSPRIDGSTLQHMPEGTLVDRGSGTMHARDAQPYYNYRIVSMPAFGAVA